MLGATYKFTTDASANLREKDDSLNTTIGAFLAGATLGLRGMTNPITNNRQTGLPAPCIERTMSGGAG